jgi:hypothetical protein
MPWHNTYETYFWLCANPYEVPRFSTVVACQILVSRVYDTRSRNRIQSYLLLLNLLVRLAYWLRYLALLLPFLVWSWWRRSLWSQRGSKLLHLRERGRRSQTSRCSSKWHVLLPHPSPPFRHDLPLYHLRVGWGLVDETYLHRHADNPMAPTHQVAISRCHSSLSHQLLPHPSKAAAMEIRLNNPIKSGDNPQLTGYFFHGLRIRACFFIGSPRITLTRLMNAICTRVATPSHQPHGPGLNSSCGLLQTFSLTAWYHPIRLFH